MDINTALEASRARFVTAQNNPRTITEQDRADVDTLTSHVIGLGAQIELLVPKGRNQSLALTALEDVLTRANKGIYVDRITPLPTPGVDELPQKRFRHKTSGLEVIRVSQVEQNGAFFDAYNVQTPDGTSGFQISGQSLAATYDEIGN